MPTLRKSTQLRMQNLLMRLSLRRFCARSLLVEMRITTPCWALFVKLPPSLFFRTISYQTKHQRLLKRWEFYLLLALLFVRFNFFILNSNLDNFTSSGHCFSCANTWKGGSLSFPIIIDMLDQGRIMALLAISWRSPSVSCGFHKLVPALMETNDIKQHLCMLICVCCI